MESASKSNFTLEISNMSLRPASHGKSMIMLTKVL